MNFVINFYGTLCILTPLDIIITQYIALSGKVDADWKSNKILHLESIEC